VVVHVLSFSKLLLARRPKDATHPFGAVAEQTLTLYLNEAFSLKK
jgi:hypothetical protein